MVTSATDLHFGVFANQAGSADPYDRAKARQRLRAPTEELLALLLGPSTSSSSWAPTAST